MIEEKVYKTIAFELYGVVFDYNSGKIRPDIFNLIVSLKRAGHTIIIWTNNDIVLAQRLIADSNLKDYVDFCISKLSSRNPSIEFPPDIAFEPGNDLGLGKVTIRI